MAAAAAESCRLRARELRAFRGDMRGTAAANCLLDQTVLRQAGLIWVWLDLTESGHEKQAHSKAVACARHTRRVVPAQLRFGLAVTSGAVRPDARWLN